MLNRVVDCAKRGRSLPLRRHRHELQRVCALRTSPSAVQAALLIRHCIRRSRTQVTVPWALFHLSQTSQMIRTSPGTATAGYIPEQDGSPFYETEAGSWNLESASSKPIGTIPYCGVSDALLRVWNVKLCARRIRISRRTRFIACLAGVIQLSNSRLQYQAMLLHSEALIMCRFH